MATVMFTMDKVQSTITTIGDTQMNQLKRRWFEDKHRVVPWKDYLPKAQEWFLGSNLVQIHGVDMAGMAFKYLIENMLITV